MRTKPLQCAKRSRRERLKCERSSSSHQTLDKINRKIGSKILPHGPCSFTGAPPAALGRTENEKAPSITGGAQKISARDFSARETSSNHPLKADSRMKEVQTMVVRWKSRITILLKYRMLFAMPATDRKREVRSRVAHFRQFHCKSYAASRRGAPRGRDLDISRLNAACLCAISQVPRLAQTTPMFADICRSC